MLQLPYESQKGCLFGFFKAGIWQHAPFLIFFFFLECLYSGVTLEAYTITEGINALCTGHSSAVDLHFSNL